jgi:hypothetical protein
MPRAPYVATETVDCVDAEALMDELSADRGYTLFARAGKMAWTFRGQSEAVWGLTPSAHRGKRLGEKIIPREFHKFAPWSSQTEMYEVSARELLNMEEHVVMQFASFASHHGLHVPTDRPELRDTDLAIKEHTGKNFPPVHQRFIYAIAQHYRVPTRLLDWTWRPLVAAYFAAIEVARDTVESPGKIRDENSDGKLAVWALQREFIRYVACDWEPSVQSVTAETTSNPNLRAQQGLFTLVRYQSDPGENDLLPPLDDVVKASEAQIESQFDKLRKEKNIVMPSLPMLYKFTLPHGQAPRLLHFLDMNDVNAASIFPGYDSITAVMKEPRLRSIVPFRKR